MCDVYATTSTSCLLTNKLAVARQRSRTLHFLALARERSLTPGSCDERGLRATQKINLSGLSCCLCSEQKKKKMLETGVDCAPSNQGAYFTLVQELPVEKPNNDYITHDSFTELPLH